MPARDAQQIEGVQYGPRLNREKRTVAAMVRLYCREQHRRETVPCPECAPLLAYAHRCLDRCPFREGKTTCARCPLHCYRPDMRARIRAVMRYAGPRMLYRHPILAFWHLMDGLRQKPARRRRGHPGG